MKTTKPSATTHVWNVFFIVLGCAFVCSFSLIYHRCTHEPCFTNRVPFSMPLFLLLCVYVYAVSVALLRVAGWLTLMSRCIMTKPAIYSRPVSRAAHHLNGARKNHRVYTELYSRSYRSYCCRGRAVCVRVLMMAINASDTWPMDHTLVKKPGGKRGRSVAVRSDACENGSFLFIHSVAIMLQSVVVRQI